MGGKVAGGRRERRGVLGAVGFPMWSCLGKGVRNNKTVVEGTVPTSLPTVVRVVGRTGIALGTSNVSR